MRYQIEELTASLSRLMYEVEENKMSYSERNAIELANTHMNRALQSIEEFTNYMKDVVNCLEDKRFYQAQEAAYEVYREAYQVMQALEDAKRKISYITYN